MRRKMYSSRQARGYYVREHRNPMNCFGSEKVNTVCYEYHQSSSSVTNRTDDIHQRPFFSQQGIVYQLNRLTNSISNSGTTSTTTTTTNFQHNYQNLPVTFSTFSRNTSANITNEQLFCRPETAIANLNDNQSFNKTSDLRPQTACPTVSNQQQLQCHVPSDRSLHCNFGSIGKNPCSVTNQSGFLNMPAGYLTPSPSPERLQYCNGKQNVVNNQLHYNAIAHSQSRAAMLNNCTKQKNTFAAHPVSSFSCDCCKRQSFEITPPNLTKKSSSGDCKTAKTNKNVEQSRKSKKQPAKTRGKSKKTSTKQTQTCDFNTLLEPGTVKNIVRSTELIKTEQSNHYSGPIQQLSQTVDSLPNAGLNNVGAFLGQMDPYPEEYARESARNRMGRKDADKISSYEQILRTKNGQSENNEIETARNQMGQKDADKNSSYEHILTTKNSAGNHMGQKDAVKSSSYEQILTTKNSHSEIDEIERAGNHMGQKDADTNSSYEKILATKNSQSENDKIDSMQNHTNSLKEFADSTTVLSPKNHQAFLNVDNLNIFDNSQKEIEQNHVVNDVFTKAEYDQYRNNDLNNSTTSELVIVNVTSGKETVNYLSQTEKVSSDSAQNSNYPILPNCISRTKYGKRARMSAAKSKEIRMDLVYLANLKKLRHEKTKFVSETAACKIRPTALSERSGKPRERIHLRACKVVLHDIELFLT